MDGKANHLAGRVLDIGHVHADELWVDRMGDVLLLSAIEHEDVGVGPDVFGLLLLEGRQTSLRFLAR